MNANADNDEEVVITIVKATKLDWIKVGRNYGKREKKIIGSMN